MEDLTNTAIDRVVTELRKQDHNIPAELNWNIVVSPKGIGFAVTQFPFQDNPAVPYTIDLTVAMSRKTKLPTAEVTYKLFYGKDIEAIIQEDTLTIEIQ